MFRKTVLSLLVVMVAVSTLAFTSPTQAAAAATGNCTQWYTVQRGDTLFRIASRFGTTMQNLTALNFLANPNVIWAGQTLCVSASTSTGGTTYVVQPGDRLNRIAQRYGVNMWVLAQVNNIWNVNLIYVGQRLVIPDVTIQ
jgi:LysM repeat protein